MKPVHDVDDLTPSMRKAIRVLRGSSYIDTRPAKSLATLMWPDGLRSRGGSLGRGGYYRAAGAYFSQLQRLGIVGWTSDDFSAGYYLNERGQQLLAQLDKLGAA
jgi:hypothetical protein